MVRSAGIEPTTICLEGRCSIQLSYERIVYYQRLTTDFEIEDCFLYPAFVSHRHERKPKRAKVREGLVQDPLLETVALFTIEFTLRQNQGRWQVARQEPENGRSHRWRGKAG